MDKHYTSAYWDGQERIYVIAVGTGRGSPARIYLFHSATAAYSFATLPGRTPLTIKQYRPGITYQLRWCAPLSFATLKSLAQEHRT